MVFRKITQAIWRALIFEREILMSARVQFVVGNFALHPDRAEFRLERAANCAGQFGDGENFGSLFLEKSSVKGIAAIL